jgi:hypothetical protein
MTGRLISGARRDGEANPVDPVRVYLKTRGAAEHVVSGGLEGLVRDWEQFVESVADGYSLGAEDYLNDLDARQLVEEALAVAPPAQKKAVADDVRRADDLMRTLAHPVEKCLWGDDAARANGWVASRNWWYFVIPTKGDPDLLDELKR